MIGLTPGQMSALDPEGDAMGQGPAGMFEPRADGDTVAFIDGEAIVYGGDRVPLAVSAGWSSDAAGVPTLFVTTGPGLGRFRIVINDGAPVWDGDIDAAQVSA